MSTENEDIVARVLRVGGPRFHAPADVEARVRRAFLDECHDARRRVRRRRVMAACVLAAAAAIVVMVRLDTPRVSIPVRPTVAMVERLEGDAGSRRSVDDAARSAPLRVADDVRAGEWVETTTLGRLVIRIANGVSLRLDKGSKVLLRSPRVIDIEGGAVYVDSGADAPSLDIYTAHGIVRDIGTQFEVRVTATSLRLRVRSGVAELHRGAELSRAAAGTELTVTQAGVASTTIAPFGLEWDWAARLAPDFPIEGKTLGAYLEFMCREQGWTLTYRESALGREAQGVVVHGSVDGLQPLDAVSVVLASSGFAHEFSNGELLVSRVSR